MTTRSAGPGRRRLLTAGLACLGVLGGVASAGGASRVGHRLTAAFGPRSSFVAVGEAALRAGSIEADSEHLGNSVLAELGWSARRVELADMDDLRAGLRACIRRDFAANRTVELCGWRLALTEVRLCGLAAMVT